MAMPKMYYKNDQTKKVGEVVHYKGGTTTLRFDDGSELILSSYTLRNEWKRVKDKNLDKLFGKKFTFEQFTEIMTENNYDENYENELEGVIVYSNDNFDTKYPVVSRSYRVTSASPYFFGEDILVGDCMDKSEFNIWLSDYDWEVEYCYFTSYYYG